MRDILDKLSEVSLTVVGDIMLDHYIWGDALRISPEAPVPVVSVHRDSYTAGGAANVALNLRGLGAACSLCGCLGQDESGQRLQQLLQANSIALHPAFCSDALTTIVKTRVVVQKQQMCRIDREEAPARYAFALAAQVEALQAAIAGSSVVILSDYAKGSLTAELLETLKASCREHGALILLDPKPKRDLPIEGLDLLTPNRTEAYQMAGLPPQPHEPFPAEAIVAKLRERWQPRYLVITLGADGMLISREPGHMQVIPTAAREVFDVSGAGDTVIATLGAALAAGADLEMAARLANLAAGIVVAKVGTASVTLDELRAAVESV